MKQDIPFDLPRRGEYFLDQDEMLDLPCFRHAMRHTAFPYFILGVFGVIGIIAVSVAYCIWMAI